MITLTSLRKGGLMDKSPEKKTCMRCKVEKEMKEFRKDDIMKNSKLNYVRLVKRSGKKNWSNNE